MNLSLEDLQRRYGVQRRLITELVKAGLVRPVRGERGEYRFGFQDIVVLRMAAGLQTAGIPVSKASRFLHQLHAEQAKPLSAIRVTTCGGDLVVREGEHLRSPSGQYVLDLGGEIIAPPALIKPLQPTAELAESGSPAEFAAAALYLEATDPTRAAELYGHAIALDENYSCAYVNLSCLLIEQQRFEEALVVCKRGLEHCPGAALLHFNRGVVMEELHAPDEALHAYQEAITCEPGLADAHYNLHLLYEAKGEQSAALRHLSAYCRLQKS